MPDDPDTQSVPERQRRKGRRAPNDGEIGIRYGSRNYLITPGQALVARSGDWHLVWRPGSGVDGWGSFKLYCSAKKRPKNLYMLSSFQGVLIKTRDAAILAEHHPEIREWVNGPVRDYWEGRLIHRKELGKPIVYQKGKWRLLRSAKKDQSNG